MTLYGKTWTLSRQQQTLRLAIVLWLAWVAIAMPVIRMLSQMPANVAWGLAILNVVWLAALLPWLWPAKNGNMLILSGMLLLINLGFSVLAILQGGISIVLGSVESLLVLNVLYWLMWVIERLPKLQASADSASD